MSATNSYKVDSAALKLAREIASDPDTRAKIKVALEAEGKPGLAALIDEAVLVAREVIRLAELPPCGPKSVEPECPWRMAGVHECEAAWRKRWNTENDGAVDALKKINDTIYAKGAPLGSPEYFAIREAACSVLYPNKGIDATGER